MRWETDPDVAWVEALSGHDARASRKRLAEAQGERRLFAHLAREHDREGRESYVEIDAPFELYALVRLLRPTHVVEVGVSSGVSSAYLLSALDRNGHGTLHSVDRPARARPGGRTPVRSSWSLPAGRSSGWAVPEDLRARWDLRIGDKARVLPLLARELPRIDLFLYDVPHEEAATRRELGEVDARIPPGGVVIIDHGPGGGLCPSLRRWARSGGARPWRREGTGLYGARRAPPDRSARGPGASLAPGADLDVGAVPPPGHAPG
ncbi:MAG TPA: class I SAM-dependent methyltransferase [Thermoplasmata archaeon]|nr:class I SAM-dependent methyltransferase [Thermoplasmata archaeon]